MFGAQNTSSNGFQMGNMTPQTPGYYGPDYNSMNGTQLQSAWNPGNGAPTVTQPNGYGYQDGNVVYQGGNVASGDLPPVSPYYNSVYNSQSQSLTPLVQQDYSGINTQAPMQAADQFAALANRQGASPFTQQAQQNQNYMTQNALNMGAAQANSATGAALGQIGGSGGISSGARERAAEGGAQNYMNMSQNAQNQNTINQGQLSMNDYQNKMQEMGLLPGMYSQALQPQFQVAGAMQNAQSQDIANQMAAAQAANKFNLAMYDTQGQIYGGIQMANATRQQNS